MLLRFVIFGMMTLGVVGFGTVAWLGLQPAPPPPVPVVQAPPPVVIPKATYLVAARPVRAGTLLRPEDLTSAELPVADAAGQAIAFSPGARYAAVGAMVRKPLNTGDLVLDGGILRPGDRGFLAAVLSPGTRAISIPVDAATSAGGLISPGDHIDLLLTQALLQPDPSNPRRVVGETVLRDLRVVAVDRNIVQGAQGDSPDSALATSSRTLTLEVTPDQAERLVIAQTLGKLGVSVRAIGGDPGADEGALWASDVSKAFTTQPANSSSVNVFAGAGEKKEYKF